MSATPTTAPEIGGGLYKPVVPLDGEVVIESRTCYYGPAAWGVVLSGKLYLTTARHVWTPGRLHFYIHPVVTGREDVTGVRERQTPLWIGFGQTAQWEIATRTGEDIFSFGLFSAGRRDEWMEKGRQWASLSE